MNILIGTMTAIDPILVEQLVQLPDASIHLSLSNDETSRLIREVSPEILITDRSFTPDAQLNKLLADHEGMEIYLYKQQDTESGKYSLTRLWESGMLELNAYTHEDYPASLLQVSKAERSFNIINNYPR
jgi:hypothetical protein